MAAVSRLVSNARAACLTCSWRWLPWSLMLFTLLWMAASFYFSMRGVFPSSFIFRLLSAGS